MITQIVEAVNPRADKRFWRRQWLRGGQIEEGNCLINYGTNLRRLEDVFVRVKIHLLPFRPKLQLLPYGGSPRYILQG